MVTTAGLPLFDAAAALRARDEGIDRILRSHASFIARARSVAVLLAERHGTVTADDLRAELEPLGVVPAHPNAWGASFCRHPRLEWTGEYRRSAQPQGHANMIRAWRLRRDALQSAGPE